MNRHVTHTAMAYNITTRGGASTVPVQRECILLQLSWYKFKQDWYNLRFHCNYQNNY